MKVKMEDCGTADSAALLIQTEIIPMPADDDSLLVKIFPNPNKGVFTLEVNMPEALDPVEVELINSMGQIVYRKMISQASGYINEHIELESSVPTGIYFLQVTTGKTVEKTRMMLCR